MKFLINHPLIVFILLGIIIFAIAVVVERDEPKPDVKSGSINRLFIRAQDPPAFPKMKVLATVTGYNPVPEQTDDTPLIMASGKKVYEGAIACPREIPFGTTIEIDGKAYTCEDRTAKKYDGRFDILFWSYEEAISWGKVKKEVTIYK